MAMNEIYKRKSELHYELTGNEIEIYLNGFFVTSCEKKDLSPEICCIINSENSDVINLPY